MKRPVRRLPAGLRALAATTPLLIALALSCAPLEEPGTLVPRRDRPEQVFLDARVELQEGALVRGAIRARRMEQVRRRSLVRMSDSVEVVSWDSLGRAESLTLCDTLLYRRDRQDLSAAGHVRLLAAADPQGKRLDNADPGAPGPAADLVALRRHPPFQLHTPRLEWVQRIRRIQTEDQVVFYTPYDTLHGVGFSSDRNLRNWEIHAPVGVTHRARGERGGTRAPRSAQGMPATAPPAMMKPVPAVRPPIPYPHAEPQWKVPPKPSADPQRPKPKPAGPVRPTPTPQPAPPWPQPGGGS